MGRRMRGRLALLAPLAVSTIATTVWIDAAVSAAPQQRAGQNGGSTAAKAEHFTFNAPQAPLGPVDPAKLRLSIHRWSTDAERDTLVQGANERGVERLLESLGDSGTLGYLRWPGGLEYSVRYARRTPRADGGQDIVLVLDRPLWVWWNKDVAGNAAKHPFEVVTVRMDRNGKGEGRVADPSAITVDKTAGVTFANFDARPVVMTDVQRDTMS